MLSDCTQTEETARDWKSNRVKVATEDKMQQYRINIDVYRVIAQFYVMVPATGLEPVQCYLLEPESSASANSATRA
jgi:hypothetical protein